MNHDLYCGNLQLSGWRQMGKQRSGHGTKCRELAQRQQCPPVTAEPEAEEGRQCEECWEDFQAQGSPKLASEC